MAIDMKLNKLTSTRSQASIAHEQHVHCFIHMNHYLKNCKSTCPACNDRFVTCFTSSTFSKLIFK